jgi:peptidoglycan hydrolase-like protein with peptidoglycan-binding domain
VTWSLLRSQVETLRQEADLLTQARDLAKAELVTAATGMRDLVDQLNQARSDMAQPDLLTPGPITSEQLVTRTAQKALTRLGYGPLKADGVAGPDTHRAVEAFQRANNLHVTGELDAPTLQRLTPGKLASQ